MKNRGNNKLESELTRHMHVPLSRLFCTSSIYRSKGYCFEEDTNRNKSNDNCVFRKRINNCSLKHRKVLIYIGRLNSGKLWHARNANRKIQSHSVAENYAPWSNHMKQEFTCLPGCHHRDYILSCSEQIKFTGV